MSTIFARQPLEILSMSALQSGSRRHSARLQQKDDSSASYPARMTAETSTAPPSKKRKTTYSEDDDGFAFTRVKSKKSKPTASVPKSIPEEPKSIPKPASMPVNSPQRNGAPRQPQETRHAEQVPVQCDEPQVDAKKKRKRMSFSTPAPKKQPAVRRSKRLSSELQDEKGSPRPRKAHQELEVPKKRQQKAQEDLDHPKRPQKPKEPRPKTPQPELQPMQALNDESSATKIALPFADTPVISRNKAMREGKGKGERRSSLGLRGRRASSLIDTGNSNALPHTEVQIEDFYKHIESELLEPRRMRQLLTWCATRAMHPKPQGTSFEDASAKSAARVIEEEVLKDLANKSELSDWFSRDDGPVAAAPLPERPHPKNLQNSEKISELELQIQRLKQEKASLESLLKPPEILSNVGGGSTDKDLLSPTDTTALLTLDESSNHETTIATRLSTLLNNLAPSIDTFADGMHCISQYRTSADRVVSQVLAICAEKLDEREREGRKKTLGEKHSASPGRDLSSVLRGLSKAD